MWEEPLGRGGTDQNRKGNSWSNRQHCLSHTGSQEERHETGKAGALPPCNSEMGYPLVSNSESNGESGNGNEVDAISSGNPLTAKKNQNGT